MSDHRKLTEMAFETIAGHGRNVWEQHARDINERYCSWPDQWFDPARHAEIDPYQLVIDGYQFHYPPIGHVHHDYLYWQVASTLCWWRD